MQVWCGRLAMMGFVTSIVQEFLTGDVSAYINVLKLTIAGTGPLAPHILSKGNSYTPLDVRLHAALGVHLNIWVTIAARAVLLTC